MHAELIEARKPPPQPRDAHNEDVSTEVPRQSALRFTWVFLLFLTFRWLALLLLRPGGFIRDWSDFDTFLGFASLSDYGVYPFIHYWLEWPPLMPWVAVGAYQLSALLPAWTDDARLWFVVILGSVYVLFEAGNLALIYLISKHLYPVDRGDVPVLRPVWLYALLFVPLYTMLGFFDAVALFFLLLALYLVLRGQLVRSAVATGVGFMVKLIPLLFLPVAVRQLWHLAGERRAGLRDGVLYLVGVALAVLVLAAPFLLIQPAWLLAMLRSVFGRSSWETVWAVMEGYYGFGVVAGNRFDAAENTFAVHAATLPWWWISLAFLSLYAVIWVQRADYTRSHNVVALTGFTLAFFLLYSKGYSPQFLVYLLPFIVLLFPNRRGVVYSLLLTALNVLEQPIYFVLVPDARRLLLGIVVARWLILGVLTLEFAYVIWGATLRRLAAVRRYAPVALSALIGLGLVAGLPEVAQSYAQRRLREEPAAPLIGYLNTQQARTQARVLVLDDHALLRHFKPYLHTAYTLRVMGGVNLPSGVPNHALEEALGTVSQLWFVAQQVGGRPRPIPAELGSVLVRYTFAPDYQLALLARRGGSAPLPVARLTNGVDLIASAVEKKADHTLQVTLYWWAVAPPTQSYTVFTHLWDGAGQFVAGHDSFPDEGRSPTHTWRRGHVYADAHAITLPANLPRGRYTVVTGMYNYDLQRVPAYRSDGGAYPDFAIPVEELDLP
ncbi:MAG: hypothetical protein NZ765_05870 [Anaerolineae bacterium]|nr:hypothetical protein [Anaerolineae bacterium]MDW8071117.1 hypothetical protein [Anaerolineae bacterium]